MLVAQSFGVDTQVANPVPATPPTAALPPSLFGVSGGGTVELGQPVTLTVVFNTSGVGTGLTYQWRKNGTAIAGATEVSLSFTAVTSADAGSYSVTVSNVDGSSVASTDVTVKTLAAPVVTSQPRATVAQVGQQVVFSFLATGSYPRTHQWRKDGVNISGASQATYTIAAATTADAGTYSVVVSNSAGSATSSSASLTVNAATPPVISSNYPSDQTVTVGQQVSMSVLLNSGSSPFSYQWMKGGVPIAGATSSPLTFTAVAASDAGRYSVTVSNVAGSATSREAVLTVNPPIPISFYSHPSSQTLFVGQSLNLSVSVSGSSPIAVQWQKNSAPISGATSSSFYIAAVALSDAGSYTAVLTNAAGSVTSGSEKRMNSRLSSSSIHHSRRTTSASSGRPFLRGASFGTPGPSRVMWAASQFIAAAPRPVRPVVPQVCRRESRP